MELSIIYVYLYNYVGARLNFYQPVVRQRNPRSHFRIKESSESNSLC
jgi:hypothetical protein